MTFTTLLLILMTLVSKAVLGQIDFTHYGATESYSAYLNHTANIYDEIFTKRRYDPNRSPINSQLPLNWTTYRIPIWRILASKEHRFLVYVYLAYSKIINVDAQGQIFSLSIQIMMHWADLRLAWKPEDFGDVKYFWTHPDTIWLPDHNVGNAKTLDEVYPPSIQQVKLWHNGSLVFIRNYYTEVACSIDVAVFPFDRQMCQLTVMSTSADRNQMQMFAGINTDFPPSSSSNGEWICKNITADIEQWGGQMFTFDVTTFTFELHRVPNFYIYVIAIPCFILTGLSMIGMFWTPNEKEEQLVKLSIGLTSLVSMTVLLEMVASAIPKTTKFPLLGIYVVISVVIIALACVMVVAFPLKRKSRLEKQKQAEAEKFAGQVSNI